jgi:hypothetical protein
MRVAIHRTPMAWRPQRRGRSAVAPAGGEEDLDFVGCVFQPLLVVLQISFPFSISILLLL